MHIRFMQSLDAYPKGTSHHLPPELGQMYVNAGIAEVIDEKPAVQVVGAKRNTTKPDAMVSEEPAVSTDEPADSSPEEEKPSQTRSRKKN